MAQLSASGILQLLRRASLLRHALLSAVLLTPQTTWAWDAHIFQPTVKDFAHQSEQISASGTPPASDDYPDSARLPAPPSQAAQFDQSILPPHFVVVDKTKNRLYLLDSNSQKELDFAAIYGQAEGDKQYRGDLRTPEGVYFIVEKIPYALDFQEYGTEAHALNYPNPIDRLHGKSGSGIWIHSKGEPIAPQRTRGCVAIDLADIEILGQRLHPGMPVIIAQNTIIGAAQSTDATAAAPETAANLERTAAQGKATFPENAETPASKANSAADADTSSDFVAADRADRENIRMLTQQWNDLWSAASPKFFDFYDVEAYEKAQGTSFSLFRKIKEHIFRLYATELHVVCKDIRVLQGPDYWVSWFDQTYSAPNLSTRGIRRLYWQKHQDSYKIVGMEWLPHSEERPPFPE